MDGNGPTGIRESSTGSFPVAIAVVECASTDWAFRVSNSTGGWL